LESLGHTRLGCVVSALELSWLTVLLFEDFLLFLLEQGNFGIIRWMKSIEFVGYFKAPYFGRKNFFLWGK